MTVTDVMSPELALIDPLLREKAIAALSPLDAGDFVGFGKPLQPGRLVPTVAAVERPRTSLLLAAAAYTAAAIFRVLVFDLSLVLLLILLILALSVVHR